MKKQGYFILLIFCIFITSCAKPQDIENNNTTIFSDLPTSFEISENIDEYMETSWYNKETANSVYSYLDKNVPEIMAFALYLDEQSGDEINQMAQIRSFPDENSDNIMERDYFAVYIGENHHEYIVNWQWFYVNKNLNEILHGEIISGECETLEQWRNSEYYPSYLIKYMRN